jgi:hypothetical protein
VKEFIKRNFTVVLAFLLPVFLIIGVALSVYLPSARLQTDYNFVYVLCGDTTDYYSYRCEDYLRQRYSIEDDRISLNEVSLNYDVNKDEISSSVENYTSRFFLHDTEANESREITLDEVQILRFSNLVTSPDGITVSNIYNRSPNFFLIVDGNSSYGYYLTKGKVKSKLNLINDDDRYYYRGNFKFIGWVLPNEN